MNSGEAKKLKVGDKIQTDQLPVGETHVGEIYDTGYNAVSVKWDDGQVGTVHINDMEKFALAEAR